MADGFSKMLRNLQPGDIVVAGKDLDPEGCNVKAGTYGVVFGEINYYGDDAGPIVRWFTGEPLGVCNVYDGDID
jgi:hypothetical protein